MASGVRSAHGALSACAAPRKDASADPSRPPCFPRGTPSIPSSVTDARTNLQSSSAAASSPAPFPAGVARISVSIASSMPTSASGSTPRARAQTRVKRTIAFPDATPPAGPHRCSRIRFLPDPAHTGSGKFTLQTFVHISLPVTLSPHPRPANCPARPSLAALSQFGNGSRDDSRNSMMRTPRARTPLDQLLAKNLFAQDDRLSWGFVYAAFIERTSDSVH